MRQASFVCAVFLVLANVQVVAQETTGQIHGTVASEDGVPLPGVQVTVENPTVGYTRAVVTQVDGRYRFPALVPATYQVTARLDGFQASKRQVNVDLGRAAAVELSMEVGSCENRVC